MKMLLALLFCWTTLFAGPEDVLDYWFGDQPEPRFQLWFMGGEEVDRQISERFGDDLERAACGRLTEWEETPRSKLALIVLLDQFSRNVYRGTPKAFAQDERAQQLALEMIRAGDHLAFAPYERAFLYMPLEHAEDLLLQEMCVASFQALHLDVPVAERQPFASFLSYAREHRDCIARFGRFPYRNSVLGRETTPDERAYLAAR